MILWRQPTISLSLIAIVLLQAVKDIKVVTDVFRYCAPLLSITQCLLAWARGNIGLAGTNKAHIQAQQLV